MSTEIYRRPADVTLSVARRELRAHLKSEKINGRIVNMDIDPAKKQIVATVKLAELPMGKGEAAPPLEPPADLGPEGLPDLDKGKSKEEEILDLLHQIADKVGVHDGGDELDKELGEDMGDADLGEPLPAPVEEPGKDPIFSSVLKEAANRRSFVVERSDAGSVSNEEIVKEIHQGMPGHRVARIVRNAENTIARIAVTKVR